MDPAEPHAPDPGPAPGPAASARPPEAAAPSAPAPVDRRSGRRPRDMVLSLAVLLIPIALLLTFYRLVLNGDAPATVDPGPAIEEARSANAFPVAVPTGLGGDWHVAHASFRHESGGATLRIGYVDPDRNGLQLIESSVSPSTLLPAEVGAGAKPADTYRAEARVWRLYAARSGGQALVLAESGRTIIVVGRTGTDRLETLARSLS